MLAMMTPSSASQTHAIILTAGLGSRLAPHTESRPKVLVPVAGEPMLTRMMRQLAACGVTSATLVTGDRGEQVEAAARAAAGRLSLSFVHNPHYATTNNSYSLSLAAEQLRKGALLIEGDVVADPSVIASLVRSSGPCWVVRPFLPGMDGAVLRPGPDGRLAELTIVKKGAQVAPGAFKSMGLLHLDPAYGSRLAGWLAEEVATGGGKRYYDLVISDHLRDAAPMLLSVADGFWMEVDTPEDLELAERGARAGRG